MCPGDQVGRNAHMERDSRWLGLESCVESLFIERPSGVIDGKRPAGEPPEACPMLCAHARRTTHSNDASKCPGLKDSRSQLDLLPRAEGSKHDRHGDVEQFTQTRP